MRMVRLRASMNVRTLFVVALVFVLTGCGAVAHNATFEPGFAPVPTTLVRVGNVIDSAPKEKRGDQANFDVIGELRTQLEDQLDQNGLLATETTDGHSYILSAEIVDYEPGSAFGRWLFPGVGSTVLSVECAFYDGETMIGTITAVRSVEAGGAYTIGAWKSIFETVAKDIVVELKQKLRPAV